MPIPPDSDSPVKSDDSKPEEPESKQPPKEPIITKEEEEGNGIKKKVGHSHLTEKTLLESNPDTAAHGEDKVRAARMSYRSARNRHFDNMG